MKTIFNFIKSIDSFALVLIFYSAIGLFASSALIVEEIHLLSNPNAELACDLNPIVTCGESILSSQGSVFGVPNPLLGVIGFSALLTIAVIFATGVKFPSWFWRSLFAGTLFGIVFSHWLIYQALYVIGSICIYCATTWAVMIALFVFVFFYVTEHKHLGLDYKSVKYLRHIDKYKGSIVLIWWLTIFFLVLNRFWYYWSTLV